MQSRHAGVLGREGLLFVYSEHRTTAGLLTQQDDAVAVAAADREGIGAAVTSALANYRDNVSHPGFKNYKPLEAHKRLLALAKVRSLRAFFATARLVSVTAQNGSLLLEPWRAEGKVSEFAPLPGKARQVVTTTHREIGDAIVATLVDAE